MTNASPKLQQSLVQQYSNGWIRSIPWQPNAVNLLILRHAAEVKFNRIALHSSSLFRTLINSISGRFCDPFMIWNMKQIVSVYSSRYDVR